MDSLTSAQRSQLRSLAHSLKPIQLIGKSGLSESVQRVVADHLSRCELIKIKVLESSPQSAREIAEVLVRSLPNVHLVQMVGRTLVFFRSPPDSI